MRAGVAAASFESLAAVRWTDSSVFRRTSTWRTADRPSKAAPVRISVRSAGAPPPHHSARSYSGRSVRGGRGRGCGAKTSKKYRKRSDRRQPPCEDFRRPVVNRRDLDHEFPYKSNWSGKRTSERGGYGRARSSFRFYWSVNQTASRSSFSNETTAAVVENYQSRGPTARPAPAARRAIGPNSYALPATKTTFFLKRLSFVVLAAKPTRTAECPIIKNAVYTFLEGRASQTS